MEKTPAPIVTFYSYKGGVGRSMAVANVASVLANKYGKRVLVVDWDLEAPGLHRFFDLPQKDVKTGLIELLYDYKELLQKELTSVPQKLFFLEKYVIRLDRATHHKKGAVSILCAGRQDKDYGKKVNEFNWQEFYAKWHGFGFMEYLKKELKSSEDIDIVLLDSRTGITDIGGICTLQLPDVVVLLFALNEQNIDGVHTMIQGINDNATETTERKTPPKLLLRPARVERYLEQDKKIYWENDAAQRFAEYLPPEDKDNPARFMKKKSIPYIGGYGFGETPLAANKDPDGELGESFSDLAVSILKESGLWSQVDPELWEDQALRRERTFASRQMVLRALSYCAGLSLILIYVAIKLWPSNSADEPVTFFRWQTYLTMQKRTLLISLICGALGACINSLQGLTLSMDRPISPTWVWNSYFRPFTGAMMAFIVYLMAGALFSSMVSGPRIFYGIAAVSGLIGMFSSQASEKLATVYATLFVPKHRLPPR